MEGNTSYLQANVVYWHDKCWGHMQGFKVRCCFMDKLVGKNKFVYLKICITNNMTKVMYYS